MASSAGVRRSRWMWHLMSCRCRRRCRDVAVLRAIVRPLLSVQRVLRSEIVVLQGEVRDAADRVAPQGCAMRFGICRIAAGHRMRRHSPICPGMPSLTVGKDLGQRLASDLWDKLTFAFFVIPALERPYAQIVYLRLKRWNRWYIWSRLHLSRAPLVSCRVRRLSRLDP